MRYSYYTAAIFKDIEYIDDIRSEQNPILEEEAWHKCRGGIEYAVVWYMDAEPGARDIYGDPIMPVVELAIKIPEPHPWFNIGSFQRASVWSRHGVRTTHVVERIVQAEKLILDMLIDAGIPPRFADYKEYAEKFES